MSRGVIIGSCVSKNLSKFHSNPAKTVLINRIQGCNIFSKFDLKSCLEEKCVELQIQNQLKKTDYKFCKDIFTPQTYGNEEEYDELGLENYYEPIKEEDNLRLEFVERKDRIEYCLLL